MRRLIIVILFFLSLPAWAQHRFVAMTYNVENLFDTKNDSLKDDSEFLPDATRHWSLFRYWRKLANISRVIASASSSKIPDIVCLCEVENDSCMFDLTHRSSLRSLGYRYVMTNSSDRRGVDVAFLYQRGSFKLVSHESISPFPKVASRDILHVVGQLRSGDTLDVFCVHFPSRIGGKEAEGRRLRVATLLRSKCDSLLLIRKKPSIILMGDFNDSPSDNSLITIAQPVSSDSVHFSSGMYNLMTGDIAYSNPKVKGTYRYQGYWDILDQILVNGATLVRTDGFRLSQTGVSVADLDFLLEDDDKYGGVRPFRTYIGMRYNGGYSDHLPVVAEFFD